MSSHRCLVKVRCEAVYLKLPVKQHAVCNWHSRVIMPASCRLCSCCYLALHDETLAVSSSDYMIPILCSACGKPAYALRCDAAKCLLQSRDTMPTHTTSTQASMLDHANSRVFPAGYSQFSSASRLATPPANVCIMLRRDKC